MKLLNVIAKTLDDVKNSNILIYDMQSYSPLFDYMVIASASSDRQADATLKHLKDELSKNNFQIKGIEPGNGEWILIDCVDVVVNIFVGDTRGYYGLEKLFFGLKQISLEEVLKNV